MAISCHDALLDEEGKIAYDFIENRKINKKSIDDWLIGFCPPYVSYTPFPLLRGRVIVPISDIYGNIVALFGRKIESMSNEVLNYFKVFLP